MGYFIFHRVSKLKLWFSRRSRARRAEKFMAVMDIKGGERIVDLGGAPEFWDNVSAVMNITILNLPGYNPPYDGSSHHKITVLEGDACAAPFADQSFDIAFSNSVIEHVGGEENENRLASEVHRLAPAHWVQTPSVWFPIEAHNNMPFWWFYPTPVKKAFMRSWRRRLPKWAEMIEGTVVIPKVRMRQMFPNSNMMVERSGGFVKSYTSYKRKT
ncbi:class I SAM-dependent methyltransferase [Roseobacter sp. OBYS 0001]|uniref:class I SAM-dependent methyltransferase n=1 Tax=Roseobacter sp. OBYS 0001 TaxID=882651 RepID=UPI001BC6EEAF|nr:class I SAM-dependent methyltransferase [Roseobacter sp. OBYS 0001]GIT89286.1 hypothetical protein ROBYS_43020 [Roseobacter sp. OBYS 0001]